MKTLAKIEVGDKVCGGKGEDYDEGRVVSIGEDGDSCVVAWDSQVTTPCALSALGLLPAER